MEKSFIRHCRKYFVKLIFTNLHDYQKIFWLKIGPIYSINIIFFSKENVRLDQVCMIEMPVENISSKISHCKKIFREINFCNSTKLPKILAKIGPIYGINIIIFLARKMFVLIKFVRSKCLWKNMSSKLVTVKKYFVKWKNFRQLYITAKNFS